MEFSKKEETAPENLLNPTPAVQVAPATQVMASSSGFYLFNLSGGMLANHLIITPSGSYCTTKHEGTQAAKTGSTAKEC